MSDTPEKARAAIRRREEQVKAFEAQVHRTRRDWLEARETLVDVERGIREGDADRCRTLEWRAKTRHEMAVGRRENWQRLVEDACQRLQNALDAAHGAA